MKIKIITRKDNYEQWIELEECMDCHVINSDIMFQIETNKEGVHLLLCDECMTRLNIMTKKAILYMGE